MKVWYRAVCDKHKEYTDVMVTNPIQTKHYLEEDSASIQEWLEKHYGCELKLAWRDDQTDKLYDNYTEIKHEKDKP